MTGREDLRGWDAFVQQTDGGSFCHLSGWREIMTDVLGHECLWRTALDGSGQIRGVLPLVRMKSRFFGHHLISMPFLNCGGPLGSSPAQELLSGWAVHEAARGGAKLLEFRNFSRPSVTGGLVASERKITVLLDLPASADALWHEGFGSKLRSQVKRAQRENMMVQFGTEQVSAFYEVFARNMRDLGTPVLPRALFERLVHVFPQQVVFGAAYHGATPVAAGCGFLFHDEFEMTWASSLREHNARAPNMLLYWSFMEEAIRRCARVFNFGRCTPNTGTHRFKLQWGGRDAALGWTHWTRNAAAVMPSADRGAFRLAARVWQRLPLPFANRLGPVIARRIPAF